MLTKGIKIFLIVFICFYSCDTNNKKIQYDYVKDSFEDYSDIYKTINDSIDFYVKSNILSFQPEYYYDWQVDSMLCINSAKNKIVACVLSSSGSGDKIKSDDVLMLLGKQINNKWYFFKGGGSLNVPRDMYGKTGLNPLSFHELSKIARENCLESALITDKKGKYIVNDAWVEGHFYYNGMCADCKTQAQYDSVHWFKIMDKWKHKIDTNQYKPLRKKGNAPAL